MQITRIDPNDSRQVQRFIRLPFDIYRGCPYWVPPLLGDMRSIFDQSRHPFYEHSSAAFFLAESGGETLARIAVLKNNNFIRHHQLDLGFFYFFDAVDDPPAVQALVAAAAGWGRQQGLKGIYGAKGFARADGQGILVEGFDQRAVFGAPYNHAYYDRLLTSTGFRKHTDFLSGYILREVGYPQKIMQAADRVRERSGFTIKKFRNKAEMRQWIPALEKVHHQAFSGNPGFIPSTDREFRRMAEGILLIAEPDMILLILKDEEVVGFILSYPDIAKAVQRQQGHILPFGWIDLLLEKKRAATIILNGIGILPRYQGFGANILLQAELNRILLSHPRVQRGELNQVDENNYRSRADLERIGTQFYKKHRMYVLPLEAGFEQQLPTQWKLSGGE